MSSYVCYLCLRTLHSEASGGGRPGIHQPQPIIHLHASSCRLPFMITSLLLPQRLVSATFLIILCTLHTSCVSSWMDKYSGKYRTTLCAGQSQAQVRKKIGTPIETYYAGSKNKHTYDRMPKYSYDAFRVIGKIQKPHDDCSLAMLSDINFGTSEVLTIPMITFFHR